MFAGLTFAGLWSAGLSALLSLLLDGAYLLLLIAISPVLACRSYSTGKYREGWSAKFFGAVPRRTSAGPCVWFHAVSVGEVNLLATLLSEFSKRRPDVQCVVSTTTQTGYALARKRYPNHLVFYCPLDFSWAVRCALSRIRPTALVLAELELWPNLIRLAKRGGAKVAVVNGRLSPRSFRGYRRARWLVKPLLAQLDLIAAQNAEYANRFLALGARGESVLVTGSLKFDGAQTDRQNPATARLRTLAGIAADDVVFLAGSTQEPEEQLALQVFRRLSPRHPRLRLMIVPRHPERFSTVAAVLDAAALPWRRRTELNKQPANPAARILLVDVVGELGAWWGTASVGFVGGSLSTRGGQNMIEPAAYGVATCFGPNTQNFRDVVAAMLAAEAAVEVADGEALIEFVRRALDDPAYSAELGRRAQALVASQLGATERTLARLLPLVEMPSEIPQKQPDRRAA
jgi:3-deoxy-D-manno-octulosonic-acid transferase